MAETQGQPSPEQAETPQAGTPTFEAGLSAYVLAVVSAVIFVLAFRGVRGRLKLAAANCSVDDCLTPPDVVFTVYRPRVWYLPASRHRYAHCPAHQRDVIRAAHDWSRTVAR